MKYWSSLPSFRYVKDAEFCAARVKEYFGVEVRVLKKSIVGDSPRDRKLWDIMEEVAKASGVSGPSFHEMITYDLFFQIDDPEKELLIQCFIVAWAKGHEDGSIQTHF